MAIKFRCECGKALSAKEIYAGRKVRCPSCGMKVTVPEPGDLERRPDAHKFLTDSMVGSDRTIVAAAVLASDEEDVLHAARPSAKTLFFRLAVFNLFMLVVVILPILFAPNLLSRINRVLPGGVVTQMVLITIALVVAVLLSFSIWVVWQKSTYVLTNTQVVAKSGFFRLTTKRMPLSQLRFVASTNGGRKVIFSG